jgi:hypothetical protein
MQRARFIRNGIPDGFMVRLANLEVTHIHNATRVEEKPDGSIEIWFDRIPLPGYAKGEYLNYWPVVRERLK